MRRVSYVTSWHVAGMEWRKLFLDNHDQGDFLRRVAALTDAGALTVYAWALMPNNRLEQDARKARASQP